ncbi:hypothetical protein I546_6365 [Mycobacterium kansasii 732]|nr:hypothetical protein I546_6365 [Mycobacterium kansasii 732]
MLSRAEIFASTGHPNAPRGSISKRFAMTSDDPVYDPALCGTRIPNVGPRRRHGISLRS